ncbi:family 78 glycoside hydrolase catalytic domain [Namhaeicola litoreus]|uniref:alpha-L-rhamnosidase n=1 Tax=Namhaeicola litoreus TaxID=1052145 RepID=A0ABW3Y3F0_9FLAO
MAPETLSVSEGFENPIGFYDATPTFSWKLPISSMANQQTAYQIVAATDPKLLPDNPDLWNSEKQLSNQSTYINYAGKSLISRQKVYWQIRYWNEEEKQSNWSEVNHFELGLLSNSDWKAKWTGLATASDSIKGRTGVVTHRPQYLRKNFELSSDVVSARLYVTAKGVFDAWLNGKNISDDVMPPGWTPYNKRIETITYDVTSFVASGQNTLSFELAPGWHSGRLGWNKSIWANSKSPKILCQLEILMADGSKETILSDDTWVGTTNGPIRFSEIYDGEIYDANLEIPNWTSNTFDDRNWNTVEVDSIETGVKLEPKRHSNVKQMQILPSQEVIKNSDFSAIFDLKQNMVGVPLLKVPVKKGDTLIIRFAEMLSPDGSFFTENYRSAHSTDYYIASESKTIEWSPKFTFHGFRYVELSGYDTSKVPTKDWVTGLVQYSNFKNQGNFTSSHEKLNQLQSNIIWGLRGNFFDIPTDCPQRDERLGWTGDAQVFAPTSIFNADVHAFWASWLQSLRESQFDNGGIPFVVPDVLKNDKVSSGWGDAAVVIPWEIYYRTGDLEILEENFDMMKNWINFHESETTNYISHMNSFSDWLQPYARENEQKESRFGDTPMNYISTAYFAHVTKLAQQTAEVLGKNKEEQEFKILFSSIQNAFQKEFFDETGRIKNDKGTQTGYLMAIGFGLLSDEMEQKAIPHLLEKIKEADDHLRTGFLGTPLLSKVLDKIGRSDVMFTLLLNETYPSWFYSINQGATTIWERWNSYSKTEGFSKERMNSLNHYAYGAIGQWMYERIAGIAPLEPGYKKIRIAPLVGGGLTSASGSYNSPFGIIKSSWELENEIFKLEITIPPNTKAEVQIPCNKENEVQLDGVSISNNNNIKLIKKTDDIATIEVGCGDYSFTVKMP